MIDIHDRRRWRDWSTNCSGRVLNSCKAERIPLHTSTGTFPTLEMCMRVPERIRVVVFKKTVHVFKTLFVSYSIIRKGAFESEVWHGWIQWTRLNKYSFCGKLVSFSWAQKFNCCAVLIGLVYELKFMWIHFNIFKWRMRVQYFLKGAITFVFCNDLLSGINIFQYGCSGIYADWPVM